MVDEELDGGAVRAVGVQRLVLVVLPPQLLVELDELQGLVLDVGEEVVVADEGKDVRVLQPEEVRQGFARLAVHDVAAQVRESVSVGRERRARGRTARRCSA